MPSIIPQIKVFVSCPGDVEKEKQSVIEVCESLTKIYEPNIQVKVIEWNKNVFPLITGEGPQSVINDQIKEDYDIYIGIFWKRFGDKSSNGLTPTEEEFEKAFKRYKDTRKPLISFYFKTDPFCPLTTYDTEQFLAVQKFQERIRGLGFYREFNASEFHKKVFEDIGWKIENWATLTAIPISTKAYDVIPNYLPRKIASAKEYGAMGFSFLLADTSKDTIDVIAQRNRIVLLGDAGAGKTTELERIRWHFSKKGSQVKPFFVSLNKYVSENVIELLGLGWTFLPESQTLIILDGLDEIETKNRNDAIRRIESFSEQHPSCKIIVSCRKNFYRMEREDESGTLSGFSSYVLLDLHDNDVEKYAKNRLGVQSEIFWKAILTKQLSTLLRSPFYLVSLVTLFLAKQKLPENKAEIFEHLLNDRINLDSSHFRTTIELNENRKRISETLERLALGMELLGRNYITDEEYEKLVSDTFLRSLIKHCTVWKKNEGTSTTWQFEHNNFQEYLAAKVLSKKSLQVIQNIVSFKPDFKKVIPSWINTLSFLLNISNDPTLYQWILESEPKLAIKFETSRIENSVRISVFKQIFKEYKEKEVWIPFDKYDYCELARFGQSEDTAIYLLDEIESAAHYTTRGNAIEILSYMDMTFRQKQRATQLLLKYSLGKENEQKRESEEVQARALIALARLKLNSKEIVDQVVPKLASSSSDVVRFGLYYFLHKSDYLDEHIDVFLAGIQYVGFKVSVIGSNTIAHSRLGEELWNLKMGLEKAKSPEAIMKILAHFIQNPSALVGTSLSAILSSVAENAADAYSKEPKILELAIDLLWALVNEYLKEDLQNFIRFFDKTNMRLQVFKKIFAQRTDNNRVMNVLSTLANLDCSAFIVQQYENNQIVDKDVWLFQNLLLLNNPDLFIPFNELVNKKSGNKFLLPPRRDFEKERIQRRTQDVNLLFHKEDFLEQLRLIFDKEQKQTFTSDDVIKVMTHTWDNQYFSDLAIYTLLQIAKKEPVSLENLTQIVNSWNWDWFCINEMYRYFENTKDLSITDDQRAQISEWCYSNLNKVDFKKALIPKPNGQFSTSHLAIYLWFFLRKFNLKYPPSVLLDMLSFDWIEGHQMLGIQYLEERLPRADVKERILKNLQDGIQIDDVLKNHIDYCRRNRLKECLSFALSEISNRTRDFEVRRAALDAINDISDTVADLEQAVVKISDDFKWDVVEQLVKHKSEYVHLFLREILERGSEEEKLKAAVYLTILQDLDGLKYYTQWVKQHKAIPERFPKRSPLENLERLEAIPLLIELLKVSFEKELRNYFPSLYSIVVNTFSTIALKSESNYFEVKQAIVQFMEDYSRIEGVNFLNSYLEDLEQRYYVTKSEKLDLDEVIKKLEDI